MSRPDRPFWTAAPRAFVVAGGRSSRMGQDKALLPYGGTTLLAHAIEKARTLTQDVYILCGPTRRYQDFGLPILEDGVCGVGPIGGLYSALVSARADGIDRVVWVGVDVPLVPTSLLARLVAELDRADAAMGQTSHGLEPMCAALRTAPAIESVRRALVESRLKLTSALEALNLHPVLTDDADLVNVNSPAEYRRLTSRVADPS